MKKIMIAIAALGMTTGFAVAQGNTTPAADAMATPTTTVSFIDADTDKNQDVTPAEAKVVWPDLTDEQFVAADTDKSGGLNQQEYDALVAGTMAPPSAQVTTEPNAADKPADAPATTSP